MDAKLAELGVIFGYLERQEQQSKKAQRGPGLNNSRNVKGGKKRRREVGVRWNMRRRGWSARRG